MLAAKGLLSRSNQEMKMVAHQSPSVDPKGIIGDIIT
jgi:hypothetical protein